MKIAVIGASNDRFKYGNIIVRDLISCGHDVYPVNPHESLIENLKCYKTISDLPEGINLLNFVVPPKITLQVVKNAVELGYKFFWFQPGSENPEADFILKEYKDAIAIHSCVLVDKVRLKKLEEEHRNDKQNMI
ncbi:MAG: CoA-binding protein [Candidatus Delongbacteria bacterium]|nr:CoA-binding protein [Candidatus Delongbacteria bacterium]MBN2833978.1 CoA-binding protein [Candidatus Delongbacteria bacterium]